MPTVKALRGDDVDARVRVPWRICAAIAAVVVAVALGMHPSEARSATWGEAQTLCTGCAIPTSGPTSFAQTASGAAVVAWRGRLGAFVAYRGPGDRRFERPVFIGGDGAPALSRVAIGVDGTAALLTGALGSGGPPLLVVRRSPASDGWSPPVGLPAAPLEDTDASGASVAVGPSGEIRVVASQNLIAQAGNPATPTVAGFRLPAGATIAVSDPPILVADGSRYSFIGAPTVASNGARVAVAVWSARKANGLDDVGLSTTSLDGGPWSPPQPVASAGQQQIAVDRFGNALLALVDVVHFRARYLLTYRSRFETAWPDPVPSPAGSLFGPDDARGTIGADDVGNMALVGQGSRSESAFVVRRAQDGALRTTRLPGRAITQVLGVGASGDLLLAAREKRGIVTSWGSTLSNQAPVAEPTLLEQGEPLGVGVDRSGVGTVAWVVSGSGTVRVATGRRGADGDLALNARQLRINQRISQAAVRRSNAALAALDAGLPARAFRDGGIGARAFGPGVVVGGVAVPAAPSAALGYQVPIPPASPARGRVSLDRRQLLVNQRIAQAALIRANAVAARLRTGLTSDQIADGAITARKLRPGLAIVSASGSGARSAIRVPRPVRGSGRIALSRRQLRINQRIAQAAVRRSNLNLALLGSGITESLIAPGGILARSIAS